MKEIQLKVKDVLKLNNALESILNNYNHLKIDATFQFKILGILKGLETCMENYNTIRNKKINEYGVPDNDGNIVITPDNQDAIKKFNDDIHPILDTTVELTLDLLNPEEVFSNNFDARILTALYPIIEGNE